MKEAELKLLVNIVTDYFHNITEVEASMGVPYIKDESTKLYDFTGIIGVSGTRKGGIYFTAPKYLLEKFAGYILGDEILEDEDLYDLVGEMTNTISGNMRQEFGTSFLISVPIIVKGRIEDISMKLSPPVFIIPIEWQGESCYLAVGLE